MDSHALLTAQGWRGTGHSLHASSDAIGLARPLLVSQKQNNLGLGKKQHKTSDMWWMNAFDKSLAGLDTSVEGQVVQTMTTGGLDMVMKGGSKWVGSSGGLYSSFVRGEVLGGTLQESSVAEEKPPKKKERKASGKVKKEEKEVRRAKKLAKRAEREREAAMVEDVVELREETRQERKERRAARKLRRETLDAIMKEEVREREEKEEKEAKAKERKDRKKKKRII